MILFLDIDGVLHSQEGDSWEDLLCRLPLLHEILRACPQVEVVVSSDWKHSTPFPKLRRMLSEGARDLSRRFIGVTPKVPPARGQCRRSVECRAWLEQNGRQGLPWLALDDRAAFFEPGDNLYQTDTLTGLTAADVPRIVARLKGEA